MVDSRHSSEPLAASLFARLAHSWTFLIAVCLSVWLVARCMYFVGFEGSDDMFYVRFANLWHRTPANQWEVRLLGNVLIGLSMRVFGYHEWAAALPSMLGSLTVITITLLTCRRFLSISHAWWAGLLVALVPLDVLSATNVSPHGVMVGLMTVGTLAFILAADSRRASFVAAVCLPLGVVFHWNGGYYLIVVLLAGLLVDWRRYLKPAVYVCIGGVLCLTADVLMFHVLYGDAFRRFRICMPRNLERETGITEHMDLQTVMWSLQNLVVGRPFGIALFVAILGSAIRYRYLGRPLRVMFWIVSLFWLEVNFGSLVPWEYQPFWRNSRYWHVLVMPSAVLFAVFMVEARRRRLVGLLGITSFLACVVMLNTGGTWGQSIKISRELLDYALKHPDLRFVTDVHTSNEIYVLNGLKTPSNISGTKDAGRSHFIDMDVRRILSLDDGSSDAILINPLNVERLPSYTALIQPHLGPVLYETTTKLRPICRLVPPLADSPWAVRKPAARVHAFVSAGKAVATQSATTTAP